MRISDWSSDVCSSDLLQPLRPRKPMHDARAVDDRRQHDLERPPSLEMADDRRLREIVQARAEQEIKPGSADQRDNAHPQRQAESMPDGEAVRRCPATQHGLHGGGAEGAEARTSVL